MDAKWFLGFLEGEGNFTINFNRTRKVVSPRLVFQVRLSEKKVLSEIQEFLATHRIKANLYKVPANAKYRYASLKIEPKTKKTHWLLQIGQLKSIHKLIELLNPLQWHSEKFLSFKGWRKVLKLAYPRPCSKDRLIKIAEIAIHLNGTQGRRRWTPQFIEENCVEARDGKVILDKTQYKKEK